MQYAEERSTFSDAFTINKENIDTTNRNSFEDLIQSRLKEQAHKQKEEHVKDEFLRILLTQANSIETNLE